MWAAYYAQYSQAQQQMGNGAAEGSAATAGAGAAAGSAEQNEEAYEKWIEYYKAYGMVFEAETMEKSLAEFRKQKKVSVDYLSLRLFDDVSFSQWYRVTTTATSIRRTATARVHIVITTSPPPPPHHIIAHAEMGITVIKKSTPVRITPE